MMKTIFLFVAGFIASAGLLRAQSVTPEVISSAGDYFANTNGSVSWTLGEPMGETYVSSNNFLTQGFQQPWDFGTVINGNQPVNAEVYPNPTTDVVFLQFSNESSGLYIIEIFNPLGQLLKSTAFTATASARTSVSLHDYSDGVYFITVRKNDGTETSTFRITKTAMY